MPTALTISDSALRKFLSETGSGLTRAFGRDPTRPLRLERFPGMGGGYNLARYQLIDPASRSIARTLRGTDAEVVKLIAARGTDLVVGCSFEWVTKERRRSREHRFVSAQFIVFTRTSGPVGGDQASPADARQLFRLEWQGRDENHKFEENTAAHPHWQVDALPSKPMSFTEPTDTLDLNDLIGEQPSSSKTWLSKIHLASSATGWISNGGWGGELDDCSAHAASPDDAEELKAWSLSAAHYLHHQLSGAFHG